MKRHFIGLGILMFFLSTLPVYAGAPLDTVQTNVNKVLDVLRDPKLKAESAKEIKKEKLEAIYEQMFDEVELSRRTLGGNWNKLNPAQQQEFIQLYRQILEKAYIDKILSYTNEKIVFSKENMLSNNQAEVQTKVITSSKEIPIFYRVILKDGTWKVYDVVVENVSLVQNYRSQFNSILAKNTPDQLLEILRKKVKGTIGTQESEGTGLRVDLPGSMPLLALTINILPINLICQKETKERGYSHHETSLISGFTFGFSRRGLCSPPFPCLPFPSSAVFQPAVMAVFQFRADLR